MPTPGPGPGPGPWPGPGWGPPPAAPGFGYGPPAGPSFRTVVRHRPGLGAVLGVVGLVMLGLSLTVLPWVSVGGRDTSLSDIRKAIEDGEKLQNGGGPGGGGLNPTGASLPPNATVPAGPPVTDGNGTPIGVPVTPPPFLHAPAAAPPATPAAPASSKGDYLKNYAKGVWVLVIAWAGVAVVFSTLFVPGTSGARAVLGLVMAPPIGLFVGLVDDEGTVALRVCGALATIVCAVLHFAAVDDAFPDHGGPSWGYGLWVSVAAFVLIFAGCAVGTQQSRFPAAA